MATFSQLGNYGRMGNAMFQIAVTLGLSQRMGEGAVFPKWKYQKHFKLDRCKFVDRVPKMGRKYNEPHYAYKQIPNLNNCDLFGYFQSEKYFDNCKDLVRKAFTPIVPDDDNVGRGVCGVHVRRTDYLKHKGCFAELGPDYYYQAAELVPANNFCVFSDDLKWCRENLTDSRFLITDSAPDYVDFRMLMSMDHQIIGNSSFSWWAAWMNDNPDKVVVAPKKWFGPRLAPTHPTKDLIPKGWLLV
jgi:hypothetical protein